MVKKVILTAGAACCATLMFGAGFQVLEQGAANIGNAMAGATANANSDASAAYWNPSAAMFTTKVGDLQTDVSMNFIIPSFEFENNGGTTGPFGSPASGSDGGNAGQVEEIPNFFAVYRLSEDFALTFSMTAPFGIGTEYEADWVGRFHGISSRITTFDFNPSVAWKLTDWFSISAGASAQWVHARLTQATLNPLTGAEGIARVSGDSWSAGANIGATIQYDEDGRFGFAWRTKVSHDIEGNFSAFGNLQAVNAGLVLPQSFTIGWYQRLRGDYLRKFALMAEYAYTCWSSFDSLTINRESGGVLSNTPEEWKNVSRVALGMHFYPDTFKDKMTVRLGVAWDESPVRSAELRTVRIPCSDRIWVTTGITYKYDNNIDLGMSYGYILFYNDSNINSVHPQMGAVKGKFVGHSHIVSLQLNIHW